MREIDKRVLLWLAKHWNFSGRGWTAGRIAKGIGARDGRSVTGPLKRLSKRRFAWGNGEPRICEWEITEAGRREAEAMRDA